MLPRLVRSPFIPLVMFVGLIGFVFTVAEDARAQSSLVFFAALLLAAVFLLWVILVLQHNKKHPRQKVSLNSLLPPELREMDEGERWITFNACRNVYIYYTFALPISTSFCILFPDFPYLALSLIGVLGVGQYIVYWLTIRKLNQY
ncbi:hypothetical protein ACI7RC_09305 [Brevibacillus sp. B_LB10_24]|uniref:hypothetical protein n=1 Tax=Brevibacillus sp. B_LB10_24 TaxID=3380645 RepID=UPI0038BAE880